MATQNDALDELQHSQQEKSQRREKMETTTTNIPQTTTSSPYQPEPEPEEEEEKEPVYDPEVFSCLLQPITPDSDLQFIGIRRFLLHRKAQSGLHRRVDWRCNGKGYVAFRNFINRPRNWENLLLQSQASTPNQSGRWISSPGPLSLLYEADSCYSSRNLGGSNHARHSFSSSTSDYDRFDRPRKKAEPAYSFVGMHCIFDQCKFAVTVMKFGHMSSDLLAYGAADGSLAVCTVSDPPSVTKLLLGHTKEVTG